MVDDLRERFGRRVREERERRGWTIDALAERAGIAGLTVQRVETGRVSTDLDIVQNIARGLEMAEYELFLEPATPDEIRDRLIERLRALPPDTLVWIRALLDAIR